LGPKRNGSERGPRRKEKTKFLIKIEVGQDPRVKKRQRINQIRRGKSISQKGYHLGKGESVYGGKMSKTLKIK